MHPVSQAIKNFLSEVFHLNIHVSARQCSDTFQVRYYLLVINSYRTLSQTEIIDDDKKLISAVDLYFIQDDGGRFRVSSMASFSLGIWAG